MSRLLFWLAFACLVLMAVRSKLRNGAGRAVGRPPQPPAPPATADGAVESMLCCAYCGIYYPASETVRAGGRDYCGQAHASR
jgi:uncharacterized protein